jgi:DivIVA domain-containing protein
MSRVQRDEILRHDFPVVRRGYDQAAVDAHLRRVADGLRAPAASLSAGASEQVRSILEAAEASAAEMRADAGSHVARVKDAAAVMLGRIDELERELDTLLAALRRTGERLDDGLARLDEQVAGEEEPVDEVPAQASSQVDEVPAQADEAALDGDEAGARLIALNLALNGTPRDETAAYLAEHFQLADAQALLDDVYERAGG